jgi:hypothetical protein
VALIGLTKGIISQEVYTAIIFMSILTTVLTPIVLQKWLYGPLSEAKARYRIG